MTALDHIASPKYRDQLARLHASMGWGRAGASHAGTIQAFAAELGAEGILDYGCGRATLGPCMALPTAEFDPGIPGKDALPEPADLLVATDVLEHIELDKINFVLAHMRYLARRGAFFTIALRPSKVSLLDGRNSHILLRDREWWLRHLRQAGFKVDRAENRKGLWVWAR